MAVALSAAGMAAALAVAPGAPAQDDLAGKDDFGGFRNVLPGGQGEVVNATELAAALASEEPPASFTNQLRLYTDLILAEPTLRPADLDTYFKPAGFGVPASEIASMDTPATGVTIVRDAAYGVPHVYGNTRRDTMFGAGWVSAQDRLFQMDLLRHYARGKLAEFAGPGTNDGNLKLDIEQLRAVDYTEEELQQMIDDGVRDAGPEGEVLRQDLLAFVEGVNAYIGEARGDPDKLPGEYAALGKMPEDWKPTDTTAIATLIGGIFGKGGGREVAASQVLLEAEKRFGRRRARAVFEDFRQEDDPEAPVTTHRRFPFDDPGRVDRRAVAIPDLGSFKPTGAVLPSASAAARGGAGPSTERAPAPASGGPASLEVLLRGLHLPRAQSNALLVSSRRSASGRSLAVMGPQVAYYSPQVLMEIDLHGPGIDARGATFPGISLYVLLGRGQDFAWSVTTATTDNVDELVEKLCEPDGSAPTLDSGHYVYKGRCVPFKTREHTIAIRADPSAPTRASRDIVLKLERSVHGPIQGRATVRGEPVAIAEARSTYFHELDSALAFKRLNGNEVTDARSFQRAMGLVNFAFNWFYADDRDIAFLQSGWYPRRARGTDPSLPAWGTGRYDWRGFDPERFSSRRMPFRSLPKDANPRSGYIVNWNNKQAPGWRAADDIFEYSSVHRSERLEDRLRRALRGGAKIDLTAVVKAMADAATVDLRGQEVYPWIRRVIGRTRDPEVAELLGVLDSWSRNGSHRRDLDRDNVYDESAAVVLMDAWWNPMVRRVFEPVLGVPLLERIRAIAGFDQPPGESGSAYFTGWWGYLDKDLRALLGKRVRGRLSRPYCGAGLGGRSDRLLRARCRGVLIATLRDAAERVRAKYGASMADWKLPATCDRGADPPETCDQIEFTTFGGVPTAPIPWQDRPTFQQAVEPQGHRPR